MAAEARNVTSLINTFNDVFSGVSSFRWVDGDVNTATLATQQWDKELPVLEDGLSFSQDAPTINTKKVLGITRPWFSTSEAGDVTMEITIPSVAEGLLGWLFSESATSVTTKEETYLGKKGSYKGKGYQLTKKSIQGTAMIISEDGSRALVIRHLEAYTSFEYSNPTTDPYAVKLTASLSGQVGEGAETDDFDIAFLKWEDSI